MENLYNHYHYKSGWKPVIREDEASAPTIYKKTDVPTSSISENEIKHPSETPSSNDAILKAIAELSGKISALDARLTVQAENLENMKSLIVTVDEKNKKNFWGSAKK